MSGERRRAVVTGAGRGIGHAIAERLGRAGLDVVGVDIAAGTDERCDVGDADAVAALAERVGPVDVLVNNAGTWTFAPLADTPPAELERIVRVNLLGTMSCTAAFGRRMVQQRSGSIVNISSIAAEAPNPAVGSYTVAKAGVSALTRQTAIEWGPFGVRCNAVAPGFIRTEATASSYRDEAAAAARAARVPLRRLGAPDDIAEVVEFLASDRAAYVTGQVIAVDGGVAHALFELLPQAPREAPQP